MANAGPKIYFFGDSFVHGMPFNSRTLPEMIMDLCGERNIVNFGVRGYGLDQMFIKAKEIGPPGSGGEIWVGILTWDIDRAYLEYIFGQKPRFRLSAGGLSLTNIPLVRTDREYVDNYRMPFRSWLVQAVRRRWQARAGLEREGPERDDKIQLNRALLRAWSVWAREKNTPLRVVLFHTRQDLTLESWRTRMVHAACTELALPLFDTAEVLLPYIQQHGTWGAELYQPGDFHHTDLANELIAGWLATNWAATRE